MKVEEIRIIGEEDEKWKGREKKYGSKKEKQGERETERERG